MITATADAVIVQVSDAGGRLSVPVRNVGRGPARIRSFYVNIASEENFAWQDREEAMTPDELDDPAAYDAAPPGPFVYQMGAFEVSQWTIPAGERSRLSFVVMPDHVAERYIPLYIDD